MMKNIEKFMKFLIPGPVWRWDHFTNNYDNYPVGDGQWHMIKDKLIFTAQEFVKEVFSYEKIILTSPEISTIKRDEKSRPVGKLESENGYCKYTFNVPFGESLYSFQVFNIPVLSDAQQIDAFFAAVLNYLSSAYFSLESNLSHHQQGHLLASHDLTRIADFFILNFSKTVMIEYLYYVLNIEKNMLGENVWNDHDTNRYNLELLERAYVFANELSSRKIENKEIYTGFVFHDSENALIDNSIKRIKLNNPIDFLSTKINDNLNLHFFIKWLLSVPVKKKGTTVVIGDLKKEKLRDKLVHYVEVSIDPIIIHHEESNRILLDHITNPDGALIFNKNGNLLFMSAILPFSQGKKVIGGGARHQSAVNFTSKFQCVALTVSEDGNISVFSNGRLEIKF